MADFRTFLKAAQNTAKKQAPGAKQALQREAQMYSRAAQKVWEEKGRESVVSAADRARHVSDESAKTLRATAKVAGRRYRKANMTKRLLDALRDTSIIAISLGIIWFVFSRIMPIPITWVLIAFGILVVLRLLSALFQSSWEEVSPDDPRGLTKDQLPDGARISRRRK